MRVAYALLAAVATVASGCALGAENKAPTKFFEVAPAIEGQYIVVLPKEIPTDLVPTVAAALATRYGGRVTHRYVGVEGGFHGFAVRGMAAERARSLARDRRVQFVEQVARVYPAWKRANPGWALDRIDQRSNAASGEYRYSADGEGVRVYVLDTGIDGTHTEFPSNVSFGFDATATGGAGTPCDGHGTAMAGLIGGRSKGVAPAAQLVNVKVLNCSLIGNTTANIIAGITWVTANAKTPAVANLSLQLKYGTADPALRMAVADLIRRDVLVVAAAGNDNDDVAQVEPANYPGVLTVAGSLSSGSRWVNSGAPNTGCPPPGGCGSNFGAAVGVFAPASAETADLAGGHSTPPPGTSIAAAIVSGVAAATLQTFWYPLQPGVAYRTLPSESARRVILANATNGLVTDVRTSPNRFVFAEAWPISLGRFTIQTQGGLTSASSNANATGLDPSVDVSGGYRNRFDAIPTISGAPYGAQVFDAQVARWGSPHVIADGGCGDVHDAGAAYLWLACTRQSAQALTGVAKALSVYDGSVVGQIPVGLTAAVPAGQTCSQKRSIARAVRVDPANGAVYVAGEAWCGTGARTAFLSMLDTQASTILWEKRIFDQGTSSSAVYALAVGGGKVAVAGARTLSTASSPVAHVAQFSTGGAPLGAGVDLATPSPSAAHAIANDPASGDLYVGATRQDASGAVGSLTKFTSSLTKVWDQTLNGARIYGVAVLKDGIVTAGGTQRVLPFTPATDPILNALVGMRLNPSRGFLSRFDPDGTLRWHHYVGGEQVVGLTLEGQRELGSSVLANVVGAPYLEPCAAPPGVSCLAPPAASFVESFRIK